jgi:hypothetical protein
MLWKAMSIFQEREKSQHYETLAPSYRAYVTMSISIRSVGKTVKSNY